MSRHDFSRNTVELVSSQIEALKRVLEESILSLEEMPFSWRNISFNGAIQWAETLKVRNDRNRMSTVLQNALTAYGQKVDNIEQMDDMVSKAISENADHLQAIAVKLQQLVNGVHNDPSVSGSYAGLRTTILNLDKSNGTLDFDRMTDAEREQYYQDCINMDPKDVTETDRRLMQEYCEKYLEPKVEIKDGMSDTAKENRDKYNALYEKAYPEEAAAIQTFFDNSAKDGITADDVANIKAIAFKSEDPQHTIFFEYIDQCRAETWNGTYNGKKVGSQYSSGTDSVYLNLSNDGASCNDGAYTTVFHELGHSIDDLMADGFDYTPTAKSGKVNFYTRDVMSDELFELMYSDLELKFYQMVNESDNSSIVINLSEESKTQVVDALLDGRKYGDLSFYEKLVYDKIQGDIESSEEFQNYSVSDIVGGLTNNTTAGYKVSDTAVGYGHPTYNPDTGAYYWYNGNAATYKQCSEFWAEYMSYAMTGQEEKLEDFRRVFPNACKMLDEAMAEQREKITDVQYTDVNEFIIDNAEVIP